jgi:hypothetical protein
MDGPDIVEMQEEDWVSPEEQRLIAAEKERLRKEKDEIDALLKKSAPASPG